MQNDNHPGSGPDGLFDDCAICRLMRQGGGSLADYLEAAATEKRNGASVWVAPDIWERYGQAEESGEWTMITGCLPPSGGETPGRNVGDDP